MKIFKIYIILLFLLKSVSAQNYSIIESTFEQPTHLFDQNAETYTTSGNIKQSEQVITINLKNKQFVNNITILWHKDHHSKNYNVYGSIDYLNWFIIKNKIKTSKGKKSKKVIINNINVKNKVAQFVKIIIPHKSKIKSNKANVVRIADINIEFSKNLKPKIINYKVKNIKKHSADISWKTDYDVLGQIRYGTEVDKITKVHSEFLYSKNHKLSIKDLLEGKVYYFQLINQTPDNKYTSSRVLSFKTKGVPLPEVETINIIKKSHNYTYRYYRGPY